MSESANQVRAIQKVTLKAVVVVRKDREGLPGLKRADDVDLPALRHAFRKRITVPEWLVYRQLPARADNQPVRGVEIRQRAVEPWIERICVAAGPRTKSGA